MKKYISFALCVCAVIGYAFYAHYTENVSIAITIIALILAISGVIMAYTTRRQ